ncbi:MAG: TIGR02449 family protein [Porticoccaceae bacterium]|jgi:cell division protein ZapB|nr:TIGR02449 family protein [Porticoccaceae bacterium]
MTTDNLHNLEQKIDRLIAVCDQLQAENRSLREREGALLRERSKLVEKNDTARTRVEAMISRLKNLDVDG